MILMIICLLVYNEIQERDVKSLQILKFEYAEYLTPEKITPEIANAALELY